MKPSKHILVAILFFIVFLLGACGGGGPTNSGDANGDGGGNNNPGNGNTTDVDVSTFNGTWYSPCFNNQHNFSARQKITINGTSLISEIESHANAPAATPDCPLPTGQFIGADISANLGYGNEADEDKCKNDKGVTTSIHLINNNTSGVTINTEPDLTNSITLLTGRKDDFLPASTVICRTDNNNLLFAGYEYTPGANTSTIGSSSTVIVPSNNRPSWKLGQYEYTGGSASGSSASRDDTLQGINYKILVVSTSGFDNSNGNYSGAAINISHTTQGAGTYTILGQDDFISHFVSGNNPSGKVLQLDVTVGALEIDNGTTRYEATSGNVVATVDSNGQYHFSTLSPIELTKRPVPASSSVLHDIPNSPNTISFTMQNVYNHNP